MKIKLHFNFINIFFIFVSIFYFSQKTEGMEIVDLEEESLKKKPSKFCFNFNKKSYKDSEGSKKDILSSSQNSSPNSSMHFSKSPRKSNDENVKNNSSSFISPPSDFLSFASGSNSSPIVSPKSKENLDIEAQNILSLLNVDSSKLARFKVQGKLSESDFFKLCKGEFSAKSVTIDWSQCAGISAFFPLLFRVYGDPSLKVLDLTAEAANDPAFAYLTFALVTNTTLTTVKMHLVGILEEQMNTIVMPFITPSTISVMDFRDSRLSGFGHLISNILSRNTTLTTFNLSNCKLTTQDANQIFETLNTNTTLKTLIFSYNALTEQGGERVKEMLRKNTTLTELDLFSNQLSVTGMQRIAEALTPLLVGFDDSKICTHYQSQFLRVFNLGGNYFGDEATEFIASALTSNTVLTELNLTQNNIGVVGAHYLGEALPGNNALKLLNLGDNFIGDDGTQLVVQSLLKNTKLTALHLRNNKISNDGVKSIPKLLKENKYITFIDLSKNTINAQNSLTILDAFKRKNTSLSTLVLDLFTITSEGSQYIVKIPGEIETIKAFEIGKKGYHDMYQLISNSLTPEKGLSSRKRIDSETK